MKKIIFKKLSDEILILFIVFSLTLTSIVWIIQAVNYLDIVTDDGHSFGVYFNYTLLSLPKIFSQLLPFIFFLSVFYIINLYEEKNQLLIYWTHGVTKIEFVNKIIKFSLFFLIIQFFLSIIVVPYANNKSRSFIRSSSLDFFPNLIKPKKFIDTVENLTIFIDSKNEEGGYENIILKDKTNINNVQTIIAQTGKVVSSDNSKILILYSGQIIQTNSKKNTTTFNFEETQFDLSKYSSKTTMKPKIQELNTFKLLQCTKFLFNNSVGKLSLKNFNCKKSFLKNIIQELFKRIYMPIYIVLMALTSSLLVLKSKNTPHYSIFKIIIFIICLAFIIISQILLTISGASYLNNLLFLSFPIISYIIIYKYLNSRVKFN
tara:strand:+ start:37 stop:1161 length:1125 start_codon:yes stop_codon:yes gene_type:complete